MPTNFQAQIVKNLSDGVFIGTSYAQKLAVVLTSINLGAPRTDFNGYVGFRFIVGAQNITVTSLGRYVLSGNTTTHYIEIRNSAGTSIANATISTLGIVNAGFTYSDLATPVILSAGSTYYIMSLEVLGGDNWGEQSLVVNTSDITTVVACFSPNSGDIPSTGDLNESFVPVNFTYSK